MTWNQDNPGKAPRHFFPTDTTAGVLGFISGGGEAISA